MTKFKTNELEDFYYAIINKFDVMQIESNRMKLLDMLKDINLPDNPSRLYETFLQDLNVDGCRPIKITWNVGKMLAIIPKETDFRYCKVKDLLPLIDFYAPQTKMVKNEIKAGLNTAYKKDYIILASLPGFPQLSIIDGNHRLIEKENDLDYIFKCLVFENQQAVVFLEPNSRKFIESIIWINDVVQENK